MSKKINLIRVKEEDDGDSILVWSSEADYYGKEQIVDKAPKLSAAEIAVFLDRDAENGNHHSFVGVHEILCKMLKKRFGEKSAQEFMAEIASKGGIHDMNCG